MMVMVEHLRRAERNTCCDKGSDVALSRTSPHQPTGFIVIFIRPVEAVTGPQSGRRRVGSVA